MSAAISYFCNSRTILTELYKNSRIPFRWFQFFAELFLLELFPAVHNAFQITTLLQCPNLDIDSSKRTIRCLLDFLDQVTFTYKMPLIKRRRNVEFPLSGIFGGEPAALTINEEELAINNTSDFGLDSLKCKSSDSVSLTSVCSVVISFHGDEVVACESDSGEGLPEVTSLPVQVRGRVEEHAAIHVPEGLWAVQ
jgi:hypothetical protein